VLRLLGPAGATDVRYWQPPPTRRGKAAGGELGTAEVRTALS
jgi:hypothetical protein